MRILFYTILLTLGLCLINNNISSIFFDPNTYKTKLYKLVRKTNWIQLRNKWTCQNFNFSKVKD